MPARVEPKFLKERWKKIAKKRFLKKGAKIVVIFVGKKLEQDLIKPQEIEHCKSGLSCL